MGSIPGPRIPHAVGMVPHSKRINDLKIVNGIPVVVQWLANLSKNREVVGSIPGLAQCVKDPALL